MVLARTDRWNLGRNGYLGTNGEDASNTISLTFDTLLAAVGGLVNYSPGVGTNATMRIFDAGGALLESFDLSADAPISTPGQDDTGAFRGFLRGSADIARLDIFGEYIVLDDLQVSTNGAAVVPIPATLQLLLASLAAVGLVSRRRSA